MTLLATDGEANTHQEENIGKGQRISGQSRGWSVSKKPSKPAIVEKAMQSQARRLTTPVEVFITVLDLNDNSPIFIYPNMSAHHVRTCFIKNS
ncbi:unnamed protein product [Protopolystoma xenopodis]|uniref:Cadherin domain-containing protein n=1 Tax=Protopolystoma xenopodis TaxID=117903 RepID=A0A448WNQ2_9PLAT|nr:unnamed protein product [Protopolystoma xenopodis]